MIKSLTEKRENKALTPHLLQTAGHGEDKLQKVLLLPYAFADKEAEEGQRTATRRHCQVVGLELLRRGGGQFFRSGGSIPEILPSPYPTSLSLASDLCRVAFSHSQLLHPTPLSR